MKRIGGILPLVLGLMFLSCGRSQPDNADLKSWEFPDEAFRIGRGYDPGATEQFRGDCILNPDEFLDVSWRDAQGIKAFLTETRVTSHEQLMRELSISSSTSFRYTFFTGNSSLSAYDKFTSSEGSFTWLFLINAEVGTRTLRTDRISVQQFKPDARELIIKARSGDPKARADFQRMCGTKFVRSVRLGGSISEVLEISSKAVSTVRKIETEVDTAGGWNAWRATGSSSLKYHLEEAKQRSMLKRQFSQSGGRQIAYDLSPANVQRTLDTFAQALNQQSAVVISVELADWSTLVSFEPSGITDVARQIKLQAYLRELWRHQQKLDAIDGMIYLYERGDITLTESEIAGLRKSYGDVQVFVEQVLAAGQQCYADATQCSITIAPVVVTFPEKRWVTRPAAAVSTNNWIFEYPGDATFDVLQQGSTTLWASRDTIPTTLAGGIGITLRTEVFETTCSSIADLLSRQGPVVLTSDRGEPLHYAERIREVAGSGTNSIISFGYRQGERCLTLQVYTAEAVGGRLTMSQDSPASQVVRRIAQSVRAK